jgi:uncharacterized protein DUF3352
MTDSNRPTTDPGATPPPAAPPPGAGPDTDTAAVAVPTSAIQPPPTSSTSRPSRVRWIAAGVLIALVIGITGLATLVLTSSQTSSVVLGYVPTDSVAYGELRLDLPGDQRQEVGEFLSKFPGFADQAALESKLDEVLDRLISEGTDGKQTFTKDIKPWFGGQLGFAVGPIPAGGAQASAGDAHALMLLSVKDAALAQAWFTSTMQQAGLTATTETYNGAELSVFTDAKVADEQAAFTIVDDKVALAGDIASVKAAVDTQGQSALAKSDAVTTAQAALTGDDIGFLFVDVKALYDAATEMAGSAASVPPLPDTISAVLPDWTAMRLRVEGDALRLDAVSQHKAAMPGPDQNDANGVAGFAPPSTIALVAGNDLGTTLQEWVELYRDDPALKDTFAQLDQAAGMLGGVDALVGWMGDTGVVIAPSGESVEGGLVSIPADAAAGKQLLTTIRSFLQFGGAQGGITITEEQYNGQTIVIVDLGDLSGLAGMAGALGGGALPTAPSGLPDTNVQLAYVATDEVIAIGSSPDFIKHVLDAGAGASLADEARYTSLLGRVDAAHSGVTFLDIAAVRGLIESKMATASAAEKAEYEESIKPFLVPFDAFMSTATVGSSTDQTHTIITVK